MDVPPPKTKIATAPAELGLARSPKVRVGVLAVASVAWLIHSTVAFVFRNGTPPARAWVANGVFLGAALLASAYVIARRSRWWAVGAAVGGVGLVSAYTVLLVQMSHRPGR